MVESTGSNKREFSRSYTHVGTTVRVGGASLWGQLRDVSMNGVYVNCETAGVIAGSECEVEVALSAEIHIRMNGHIVRAEADGLAIIVEEIPVESFLHLQQLVLYNADDPDQVELELRESIGIKRHPTIPADRE